MHDGQKSALSCIEIVFAVRIESEYDFPALGFSALYFFDYVRDNLLRGGRAERAANEIVLHIDDNQYIHIIPSIVH